MAGEDMSYAAPIIGGIASVAGGAMGAREQALARQQAKDAYDASVADLTAIGIPPIEAQQMVAEEYKSQGQWTPELEQAVKLGDTAMGGITTDPTYKQSQLKALGQLQQIGDSGGMTLEDRSNLERIEGGINAKQRGAREAILQDAQQRGGYGSGTALAAQLMAQQGGAEEAHRAGLDTAASAQKRALEAIKGGGDLGTNLRTQEFGEQAKIAAAKDANAQWNAANSQDVAQRNAAAKNAAAQYNLGNSQNLSNANVDMRNKAQLYNKGLYQQQFQNQEDLAKAKAAARSGQAQNALSAGNAAAQTWANMGSGVSQAATAAGQYQNDAANRKANQAVQDQKDERLMKIAAGGKTS